MQLGNRQLTCQASAAQIERVAQQLPRAVAVPRRKDLRCIYESPCALACDWMYWSLWQAKVDEQVWVHCTGGIAGVDIWYGPGSPSVLAALGAA